jgi:hypothetical protein
MKFESSLLTTIVLFMSTSALGQSAQANPQYASGYEILTKNPQGQFQPYVNRLLQAVRAQWYPLIPGIRRILEPEPGSDGYRICRRKGRLTGQDESRGVFAKRFARRSWVKGDQIRSSLPADTTALPTGVDAAAVPFRI